jgi:hypothetical protein
MAAGFGLYSGILNPPFEVLPSPNASSKSTSSLEAFDARIESFETLPVDDPFALFLKTKVERNFVELLAGKGPESWSRDRGGRPWKKCSACR